MKNEWTEKIETLEAEIERLEAENEAWMRAVADTEADYPEDVFPLVRGICKNIREYVEDIRTASARKEEG